MHACGSGPKSVCTMLLTSAIFSMCPRSTLAVDCSAKLYTLQTGSSDSCTGGITHAFPLEDVCHGWSAADSTGRLQSTSASGMRCLDQGGFAFEQFSNSLTCTGTGVTKEYYLGDCVHDIHTSMYTIVAVPVCCIDPSSQACFSSSPYLGQTGGYLYKDGQVCDAPNVNCGSANNSSSSSGSSSSSSSSGSSGGSSSSGGPSSSNSDGCTTPYVPSPISTPTTSSNAPTDSRDDGVSPTTGPSPCENGEPAICNDMSVAPATGGCGDNSVARCADGTVITHPTAETADTTPTPRDSSTPLGDTPSASTEIVSFTATFANLDFPTLDQEAFVTAFKSDLAAQQDGVMEEDVHVVAIRAGSVVVDVQVEFRTVVHAAEFQKRLSSGDTLTSSFSYGQAVFSRVLGSTYTDSFAPTLALMSPTLPSIDEESTSNLTQSLEPSMCTTFLALVIPTALLIRIF